MKEYVYYCAEYDAIWVVSREIHRVVKYLRSVHTPNPAMIYVGEL